MKKTIITTLFISLFVLLGIVHSAFALANPASVKCVEDGGVLSIQTKSDNSQYGNCTFPDGSVCEEWAYYDGTCTSKKANSLTELPATCVAAFDGCNSCSKGSNGQWMCTMMACINQPANPAAYCKKFQTTNPDPVACPAIYAPVCGDISDRVRCIKAPCVAERTYSNECMLNADGAKKISDGVCKADVTKPSFCNASYIKLVRGSRGMYVKELQQSLNKLRSAALTVDGVLGKVTVGAVKEYQSHTLGMKVDGIFGKKTRDLLCGDISAVPVGNSY